MHPRAVYAVGSHRALRADISMPLHAGRRLRSRILHLSPLPSSRARWTLPQVTGGSSCFQHRTAGGGVHLRQHGLQ
jgi:hypothetical protein